ncbi:hypothetical protein M8818_007806 [Zalaria obscura]|uniref:Uncharacterized protein n=1 Tax=Zalaria obscura TaxID=2024903 RepID=A0ACC3S2P7_9PEZI
MGLCRGIRRLLEWPDSRTHGWSNPIHRGILRCATFTTARSGIQPTILSSGYRAHNSVASSNTSHDQLSMASFGSRTVSRKEAMKSGCSVIICCSGSGLEQTPKALQPALIM